MARWNVSVSYAPCDELTKEDVHEALLAQVEVGGRQHWRFADIDHAQIRFDSHGAVRSRLHVKLVLDAPNVTSACSRTYSIAGLAAEDAIGYAPPIVHVAADLMDGETIG